MKRLRANPHYLLFIAAILQIVWGFVPSASKMVIDEIPVELYIAVRWSISGTIFALYLFITKSWRRMSLKDFAVVSFLGICGYGLASVGTLYGLKTGGVTNFALLSALGPAITSVIAIWILKERPERLFLFALPISILGLSLLVFGKYQVSSFDVAGLSAAFIVFGYIMEAFVFVFSKKFKARVSAAQYLAVAQISAASIIWLLQLTSFHQVHQLQDLSFKGVWAAIFVSVVACVLCYAVLYWLLKHMDGHRLALFDAFHALSATLFGYLIFHEHLTPLMLTGGALILLGLITGNWPKKITEEIPE